jgi:flagellin-like protein
MNFKKAEMGMGTLILFIAMILVAAVAASVLISTTGTLQNKALATGKATSVEVGTSLNIIKIYGEDGSNQDLEEFVTVVKLNSGSEPIRFEDLLLTLSLSNVSSDYTYDNATTCSATTTTDFAVDYLITGPNNMTGYLTTGDVVKLCFESNRSVTESENIKLSFVPKVGSTRVIDVSLPDLIISKQVDIFP